jgi:hypothetical protein
LEQIFKLEFILIGMDLKHIYPKPTLMLPLSVEFGKVCMQKKNSWRRHFNRPIIICVETLGNPQNRNTKVLPFGYPLYNLNTWKFNFETYGIKLWYYWDIMGNILGTWWKPLGKLMGTHWGGQLKNPFRLKLKRKNWTILRPTIHT